MSNEKTNTIVVTITETAQRAALLAGHPAQQRQVYEVGQVELQDLLALPWTTVDENGVASCVVPTTIWYGEAEVKCPPDSPMPDIADRFNRHFGSFSAPCDHRPDNTAEAIAFGKLVKHGFDAKIVNERAAYAEAGVAKEEAERDQASEWAARALDERADATGVFRHGVPEGTLQKYAPEAWAQAQQEVQRARAERDAIYKAAQEKSRGLIRDMLCAHAPQCLERFDADVLPATEMKCELRAVLLAPFAEFASYSKIESDDVYAAEEAEGHAENDLRYYDVTYVVDNVSDGEYECTDAQFQRIQMIRRLAAESGCSTIVRCHKGTTCTMNGYLVRYGIRVCAEYAPDKRVCRELSID